MGTLQHVALPVIEDGQALQTGLAPCIDLIVGHGQAKRVDVKWLLSGEEFGLGISGAKWLARSLCSVRGLDPQRHLAYQIGRCEWILAD